MPLRDGSRPSGSPGVCVWEACPTVAAGVDRPAPGSPAGSRGAGPSGPDLAPLTDARCLDPLFAGRDVAALAALTDLWRVPAMVVAAGPLDVWTARRTEQPMIPGGPAAVAQLGGPVSVRAWLTGDDSEVRIDPVWHNLAPDAIEETVIEVAALAERARSGNEPRRLVMAFQQFVAPDVTVIGTVGRDSEEVVLWSCLGVPEDLGASVWWDLLELTGPDLHVTRRDVVHKPTSTAPSGGGTHITSVEPGRRGQPSLSIHLGQAIARRCRRTVARFDTDAVFEIAVDDDDAYLVSCRLHPLSQPAG
jgi:hypothetical protein